MLEAILWIIPAVLLGYALGSILKAIRGEQWRNSIRGLIFAMILLAIAVGMLVVNFRN
jgi:membrane protein DedA with SNARE-associated domain